MYKALPKYKNCYRKKVKVCQKWKECQNCSYFNISKYDSTYSWKEGEMSVGAAEESIIHLFLLPQVLKAAVLLKHIVWVVNVDVEDVVET